MTTIKAIFIRKPLDLDEVVNDMNNPHFQSSVSNVKITETLNLTNKEYDQLTSNFFNEDERFTGKGGWENNITRRAIEITSPDRETLLIDPSGYNYARYVAIKNLP